MKHLMTLTLAAAALFSVQAANCFFRSDINCIKSRIELDGKSDSMKVGRLTNVRDEDDRKYTLSVVTPKLSGEWKEFSYTVTPSEDGDLSICLMGQWARTPEARGWVLVDHIDINGVLAPNGSFKKTYKLKNGKVMPVDFWLSKKACYVAEGGIDGSGAILVNHDNAGLFVIKNAEAGKEYTIQFTVKAAEGPQD